MSLSHEGPVAEVERKWILSKIPKNLEPSRVRGIDHYYTEEGRFTMDSYSDGSVKYVHCIKKALAVSGGNFEDEKEIDEKTFLSKTEGLFPLRKTRMDFIIGNRKWEIDNFHDIKLIMGEVEWIFPLDSINMKEVETYQVPDEITPYVISEVTSSKDFSNFNLFKNLVKSIEYEKPSID